MGPTGTDRGIHPGPAGLLLLPAVALCISTSPAAGQEVGVRPPVVAGTFYPSDPAALRERIEGLLAGVGDEGSGSGGTVRAGIVPHAALDYSGPVAARLYRAVRGHDYEAVVLIAPSHREAFAGVSIWPGTHLGTPLGIVPIDRSLAGRLAAVDDSIRFAMSGYGAEHSLEVQLPFLQTVLPGVPVVPLMLGTPSLELSYHLARTLSTVLAGHDILLLATTDLSHFHEAGAAAWLDGELLDLVRSNDPFLLGYRCLTGRLEACGVGGVVTVLEAARRLGAEQTRVLGYTHSGAVTGEHESVVGYAAVAVADGPDPTGPLSLREQGLLLEVARSSVAAAVRREALPPMPMLTPALMQKRAAFVTLRIGRALRGCVGVVFAAKPLTQQVRESAVAAARQDERFLPVSVAELPHLEYEVTLLSPMHPLDDPEDLQVGRDGLLLVRGGASGVLLPQVAEEEGWDRQTFLEQVGVKAGLGPGAWRLPGTLLFVFSAEYVR